jgi:2,4-dienoyl-CoA reductase-like NADH-dependent reductase (Old Yellow Enzyme family)
MLISTDRKHFFLGLNTGLVANKLPDGRCCSFYAQRSGHGLYCSIVGNVVIPGGIAPNKNTPEISNSPEWRRLAEAINSNGAVPGIQLATAWEGYSGRKKFISPSSAEEIVRYKRIVAEISTEDIKRLFLALRIGTELAADAGFRHVQLHAAHGYLFSLLIDRRLYSHSENVIEKIIEWAGQIGAHGIETSIRFSLRTGDQTFDEVGRDEFLDLMASLPVNYVDVSSGFYDINKRLVYPSHEELLLERRRETVALANRHTGTQFIYSGKSARGFEAELPPNVHIGLCRDLITNPDFLQSRDNGCMNTMKCHWYSRGRDHIDCGRWAARSKAD